MLWEKKIMCKLCVYMRQAIIRFFALQAAKYSLINGM